MDEVDIRLFQLIDGRNILTTVTSSNESTYTCENSFFVNPMDLSVDWYCINSISKDNTQTIFKNSIAVEYQNIIDTLVVEYKRFTVQYLEMLKQQSKTISDIIRQEETREYEESKGIKISKEVN